MTWQQKQYSLIELATDPLQLNLRSDIHIIIHIYMSYRLTVYKALSINFYENKKNTKLFHQNYNDNITPIACVLWNDMLI